MLRPEGGSTGAAQTPPAERQLGGDQNPTEVAVLKQVREVRVGSQGSTLTRISSILLWCTGSSELHWRTCVFRV